MRVAIVHYWLIGMRGGEKVVESLCKMFPNADVFTHVYMIQKLYPPPFGLTKSTPVLSTNSPMRRAFISSTFR